MHVEIADELNVDGLVLRLVQADDYPFLQSLYRDIRKEELAVTGWPQTVKDAFCDSQFAMQDKHYRAHYPFARFYLVQRAGEQVGRVYLSDEPELLALMEISFMSEFRQQGMGTSLMQWMTALANQSQRAMRLYVEPNNPARRLYERFGFVPKEQEGVYLKMTRPAVVD